jgi:phosphonoacetaldehyde hydrolase
MNDSRNHARRSPLKAVVLDWAGTTVDYGSFAPTAVFIELFKRYQVEINPVHARAPMGLMKKDHLRAIAALPDVAQRWSAVYGKPPQENDIDEMFAQFETMQIACLAQYSSLIPGVLDAIAAFRQMGLKIGSTTGYTRSMMEVLLPEATRQGYLPDSLVCPTDVPAGRPYPWMMYQNAVQLGVYPMEAVLKIGDSLVDIEEGLNAGAWTIGLVKTGNLMGLTESEVQALPESELAERKQDVIARLLQAGAHYTADSLADCPPLAAEINQRLAKGERP